MNVHILRFSDRAYGFLLWLLPAPFRREFAEPMRQCFTDLTAARLAASGPRGVAAAWVRAFPDLVGGAVREWAITLARSTSWPRYAGVVVAGLSATLLVLSQVLYPANLTRPEYMWAYIGLLIVLAGLGFAVVRARASSMAAVALGLAIGALWVLMYLTAPVGVLVSFPGAAALIAYAGGRVVARGGRLMAGLRSSLICAVTGSVALLLANLTYSLSTMASLRHDPVYLNEYHHSGQTDLAAYILGETIGGGIYAIIGSPVFGIALGLLGITAGRIVRAFRHH